MLHNIGKNKRWFLTALAVGVLFVGVTFAAPLVFGETAEGDAEIDALNLQIQNQKKKLETLQTKKKEYQAQIAARQKDQASLNNQLSLLEDQLSATLLEIDEANVEIDKTGLEVRKIEQDGKNIDAEIETQKQHIANLLRLAYKQDQASALEMILLNGSLAEFLNQAKYLTDTNEQIGESVEDLKKEKDKLEENRLALIAKEEELTALKENLEDKQSGLAYEQESKNSLLEETRSSERAFQNLLQQARQQEQQTQAEISGAEQLIRKKMSEKEKARLNNGNNTIAWPVPRNTITATFHDPDYPYRNLIGEHSGVDIRAKQGTALMAAADGYVAKVKFDGTRNYAYIMIIHGNGLATVYGHVSAVYVAADQYVSQGQVIGRTGGLAGGIGSGPFSTGSHLHFEVRLNGLPVNPRSYLP